MAEQRKTTTKRKKRKNKRGIGWVRLFLLMAIALAIIGIGAGAGIVVGAVRAMPEVADVRPETRVTSFLYDSQGREIGPLRGPEYRIMVDIDDIPDVVIEAFLAIEDRRFYDHFGMDIYRTFGAFWSNVSTDGPLQGGSTITQQLARNAWPIGYEQNYARKIQEAILAIQLERTYTKDQILEMYLNQINLGHGAYGIQAAAMIYFGKDISEVTLAEAAMIAAIPRGPAYYSPYVNRDLARERRSMVLSAMERYEMISETERRRAESEQIRLAGLPTISHGEAPYFLDYVLAELLDRYDAEMVYGGGLKVYTTLNAHVQASIETSIATHLDENFPLGKFEKDLQVSVIVMDPHTGHIQGMVGGRDHKDFLQHNRSYQSYRQPGSSIKPLSPYTAALERGWTAASIIDDAPLERVDSSGRFAPRNYTEPGWPLGAYRGLTTVREAIRRSVNVPAVRTLEQIGVETGYDMLERFGITSLVPSGPLSDKGLAMALGGLTRGVSPLELTTAYATFPAGGVRPKPIAITRVEDRYGNVLEDNAPQRTVVTTPEVAYVMTDILRGVVTDNRGVWLNDFGTGWRAVLENGWPAAGKTGTTDNIVDLWWIGFTPQYVASVWLGFDQPDNIANMVGMSMPSGLFPALIWKDVMDAVHADLEAVDFERPEGLVELSVDIKSGMLPSEHTPSSRIRRELFIRGTEPREISEAYKEFQVCSAHTASLWDPGCALYGQPVLRVFLDREAMEPVQDMRGRTLPLPTDMSEMPPTETCVEVHGSAPIPGFDPDTGLPLPVVPDPANGRSPEGTGEHQRLVIREGGFDPIIIRVVEGRPLALEVVATSQDHQLTVDGLGINQFVAAGTSVILYLTPNAPGVYHMYCALQTPNNPALNGRFIVDRQ